MQPKQMFYPKSYALFDWTNLKSFPTVAEDGFKSIVEWDKASKTRIVKKRKTTSNAHKCKPTMPWSSKRTSKVMSSSKYNSKNIKEPRKQENWKLLKSKGRTGYDSKCIFETHNASGFDNKPPLLNKNEKVMLKYNKYLTKLKSSKSK